jgi:serine/threonine protein phosphatase 1
MACSQGERFAPLRCTSRVWAIASIHGAAGRLRSLHEQLSGHLQPGDRIVYLGNYFGAGNEIVETIDELLLFRRTIMALPGGFACDVAFLRGSQEEMWAKLMQLHLAIDPAQVLEWMLPRGLSATLEAYRQSPASALSSARSGARHLARWLNEMRAAIQDGYPGHLEIMSALRRAAHTDDGALLFVHAGLNPDRPLDAQGDALWWGGPSFSLREPYAGFRRVVRGFERSHPGLVMDEFTATVDGGAGNGGPLIAACFDHDGALVDRLDV